MKKLGIFLLILAILGALVYYFFPLEMVVKKAVNKYGSEVTGTDVNLSGFHLNLKNGEATVKEITVANPSTYKTKYVYRDRYRDVVRVDSFIKTDSIRVPYPVEKEISLFKKIRFGVNGLLVGVILLIMFLVIHKVKYKG